MKKICNKCNKEKDLENFSKHKTNKCGYNNKCKVCVNQYGREFRNKNIDKEKQRSKNYYNKRKKDDPDYYLNKSRNNIRKEYVKKYTKDNKEKIVERRRQYYQLNKERILKRESEYIKKRKEEDPLFKLKREIKNLVRDGLRSSGIKKKKRTSEIIGCSVAFFQKYLESKFESWMNWDNKGKYNGEFNFGWDIDHIIPVSSAKTEGEILKLNHYTNLQPLCSYTNRVIKRNKV